MKYTKDIDCGEDCGDLLRYLLVKASPVILKVKPAVLVRITNCCRLNQFRSYDMFCVHQEKILKVLNTDYRVMRNTGKDIQVMFYDKEVMQGILDQPEVCRFMSKQGYTSGMTIEERLDVLAGRFSDSDFPHEIGVFLGYPLHDVEGFIAKRTDSIPIIRGLWRVFDKPQEALRLMWSYRFAEDIGRLILKENTNIADCVEQLRCAAV